jgi:uncharacterized protein (TIGR02001 family)
MRNCSIAKSPRKIFLATLLILFLVLVSLQGSVARAADVSLSADLVSRYIWRGLDVNSAANIQPAMSLTLGGFSTGVWGSYAISWIDPESDSYIFRSEVDLWASYTHTFNNGTGLAFYITDYFYPDAGLKFGNWNNHDDEDGPGAHMVEVGFAVSGPVSFPLTFSALVNVYNDPGYGSYYQLDYRFSAGETELDLFVGAALGSADNPEFYGTDSFDVINIGIRGDRKIPITEKYSLPVYVSVIYNPRQENAWIVFGLTI